MVLNNRNLVAFLSLAVLVAFACGKKKSSSDTSDASASLSDPTSVSTAYPVGLSLAIFPQSVSTTSLALVDADKANVVEKNAEAEKILTGQADSCLPAANKDGVKTALSETCYEFDQDMIYGGTSTVGTSTVSTYLGTKTGKNAAGEACMAAFMRAQMQDITAMVDQSLGFVGAGICQFKKDNPDLKLPEVVGGTQNIAPALKTVFGNKVKAVASAVITKLADVDGRPVYLTSIKATDDKGMERDLKLVHSPAADGTNTKTYNGTLAMVMNGEIRDAGPKTGAADKHRVLSVTYAKTAENTTKYELRTAQVHKDLVASALTSAYLFDYNVGTKFTEKASTADYGKYYKVDGTVYTNNNEAVDGMTYVAIDQNKSTGEGTMSYWKNPGGSYYENARGFNASVAKNTAGALEGCAISGAASTDFTSGTSIRRFLKEGGSLTLQAKGFWHPFLNTVATAGTTFTGPTTDATTGTFYTLSKAAPAQEGKWFRPTLADTTIAGNYVTQASGSYISRQCFKQNATTGVWEIDTGKTTETAGFEVLDSGIAANAAKMVAPPSIGDAKPLNTNAKAAASLIE